MNRRELLKVYSIWAWIFLYKKTWKYMWWTSLTLFMLPFQPCNTEDCLFSNDNDLTQWGFEVLLFRFKFTCYSTGYNLKIWLSSNNWKKSNLSFWIYHFPKFIFISNTMSFYSKLFFWISLLIAAKVSSTHMKMGVRR